MRFQTDDIIESTGGNFSKVRAVLDDKVVAGHFWTDIDGARKDKTIGYIFTEADLATYTIVKRNGKDYKPERWVPKDGEMYYYPHPALTRQTGFGCRYIDSQFERFRLDNGLCYPFTEEGKQAAIAHAKRMLEVK